MEKQWYYDAFISYRHTPLDSFAAKYLHKQLESFKLPRNAAKKLQEAQKETGIQREKTKITRVFRDEEELPLVSNLADPIMEALEKSEFLIVICSPRLKESMWCKKEIETFIKLHDREHVLAVLIEGEPKDSFPEELLYREVEETTDDGSVIIKKAPVEPLAADVRGSSQAECKKKIRAEVLRLAAPMFGCGYDDLRQRHREQRMRKIITASLAGSAVCLTFGIVSGTMAMQIRRQNVQIAKQAEEIEIQYQEAMRSNCIAKAQESARLLEAGDRIGAIETALMGYPKEENPEIPYTPQAAYALAQSLYLYEDGSYILPDRILKADTTVDFMLVSPKGSKILTVDESGRVCIWNGADGEKTDSFMLAEWSGLYDEKIVFRSEEQFFYPTEEGIALYDVTAGHNLYEINCGNYQTVLYHEAQDKVCIEGWEDFYLVQAKEGTVLQKRPWEEEQFTSKKIAVEEAGSRYAISYTDKEMPENNRVEVYDMETGEMTASYFLQDRCSVQNPVCEQPLLIMTVDEMKFAENVLYVSVNLSDGTNFLTGKQQGILYAYDVTENPALLWTYGADGRWLHEVSVSTKEDSSYMLCAAFDSVFVLDKKTGGYIENFSFGSQIVKMGNYVGTDNFLVFTRDGTWHYVNLSLMQDMIGNSFSHCTSNNVKSFAIGDGYCATLPYGERTVTLYCNALGKNLETVWETDKECRSAAINADGTLLAVNSYHDEYDVNITMLDVEKDEVLWTYQQEDYFKHMEFYPEKNCLTVVTGDAIVLLDTKEGSVQTEITIEESMWEYLAGSGEGQFIYLTDSHTLYGYDLAKGELVYQVKQAVFEQKSADAISLDGHFYAAAIEEEDTLRLYELDDLLAGEDSCLAVLEHSNAAYVESLFFDEHNRLYVVYKNGDMKSYGIDTKTNTFTEEGTATYTNLADTMTRYIALPEKEYAVIAGKYDAYLLDTGKTGENLLAHISSFLAADGKRECIYFHDGGCLYRAPVYTQEMLYKEALRQLLPNLQQQ